MPVCTFKVFDPDATIALSITDFLISSDEEYQQTFHSLTPLLPLHPEPPDGLHVTCHIPNPMRGTTEPCGLGGIGKEIVGGKVVCNITR